MSEERKRIFCSDGSTRPFGVFCEHCGAFQKIATPVAIAVYLAAARAFEELHEDCTEPRPGAAERLEQEIALARVSR